MKEYHHPPFGSGHGSHGAGVFRWMQDRIEERLHHHDIGRHEHDGDRHHHGGGPGRGPRGQGFGGPFGDVPFGEGPFNGMFGGGPFGGPRGRARRGEGRLLMLDALKDGPKHGYEIIKALEERSGGRYTPSAGTVYPVLQMLADLGLVRADQDAERRVYTLTEAGTAELEANAGEIAEFWARFAAPSVSAAAQDEMRYIHEEMHTLGRTVFSGIRSAMDGTGDLEKIRRVRQALERCKNEVREIITGERSGGSDHA